MKPTVIKATLAAAVTIMAGGLAFAGPKTAAAADLGDRFEEPAPEFQPRFGFLPRDRDSWSGFYVGGSFGYGFGDVGLRGGTGAFSFDTEGADWSAFAGRNWQQGRTLFGFEADIGSGSLGGAASIGANAVSAEINAMGSFRGRYGVVAAPGLLLYGTAGFAWASFDFELNGGEDQQQTLFGAQFGGGAELMFAPNFTFRVEYVYTDLGAELINQSGVTNRYDPDFHTVRAGLAMKF